jgi:hypothetical protein
MLSRPDKLRATRTGGYTDVELVFDGKTLTLFGKHANAYVQVEAPGSVAELVECIRDRHSLDLPGADLLSTNAFEALMTDATDVRHIGHGVVDGVECDHIAVRTPDVDWQLWVERGTRPIPRKSNRSVVLQPLSVEGTVGVNIALGVAGLRLQ